MGDFYGHRTENFVTDSSHWERMFGQAAQTILQIPSVIETRKALEEGRTTNTEIYEGLKNEISGMKDEDVKTYFGYDKSSLLKMAKPGRNEGQEYFPRFAKITGEGLKSIYAMKNLNNVTNNIEGQNAAVDANQEFQNSVQGQMDVGAVAGKFGSAFPQGNMKPIVGAQSSSITEKVSPEKIAQMARDNNVPLDQLQPEMTQASNRRDAFQLRQIDPTGTQATNMQAIGGQGIGIGENTMKTISTLPTEMQEASNIIAAKNAASAGVKADADKIEANAKLKGEETKGNEQLFKNLKDYLTATENAMAKAQDDYNNLQRTLATTYEQDDKDDILKQMKVINGKIQKYTTEIEKTREQMRPKIDIKEEEKQTRNASESTKKDTSKILSYVKSNGSDYETGIFNYAKSVEQTTGKTLGITVEKLRTLLDPSLPEDQRATVSQIVQAIRQQAGLE